MLNSGAFVDRRSLQTRLAVLRAAAIAVFAALAVAFWILQVVQHAKYETLADNNYLRTIALRAPRGVLVDRHGDVLVENQDSFTIAFVRERTQDLDAAVRLLAEALSLEAADVRDRVQAAIRRKEPAFRPVPIVEHATFAQVAAVKARQLELPEVVVDVVPTRAYGDDGVAAHLFGYVGEIQEAQLARPEFAGLEAGAHVGQTGVERAYNTYLMGTDGRRNVVVNSRGREIAELGVVPPVEGSRLQLTVDRDLQRALESSFAGLDLTGAAVVLAPATGEVLAMTSLPAFDPNEFAQGIGARRFAELNRDPRKLFQNKLLQGRYAPGSTFKIVMALAGLGERVITPEHTEYCPGFLTAYGRTWQCSRKAGHGTVDLKRALQHSCNVYFYKLGDRLSVDQVHAYSERLGLTTRTGVDLPGEGESIIPSTEWKRRVHGDRWYPGETLSVAIGQGYVTVTPIAMAAMVAAVANGGTVVTPHVLKAVDEGQGWQPFARPEPRRATPIDAADRAAVIDGLWRVVNEPGGTAYASRLQGRDLVGKTGTAQTISLEGARKAAGKIDTRDNAWFVFFAPRDNPQIAGVVFAEAGLHGSSAAPIAKHVVDTYFAKLEGRPLPAAPRLAVAAATPAPTGAPGPGGTAVAFGPGAGRAGRR